MDVGADAVGQPKLDSMLLMIEGSPAICRRLTSPQCSALALTGAPAVPESPVIIQTATPMSCNAAMASAECSFTVSATAIRMPATGTSVTPVHHPSG